MSLHITHHIDVTDITGVQLECSKCGTKLSYSGESLTSSFPLQCPGCKEQWMLPDTDPLKTISPMIGHITRAKEIIPKCQKFKLTLEVSLPTK